VPSRHVHGLLIALAGHFGEHFPSTRTHRVLLRMLEITLFRQTTNQLVEPFLAKLIVVVNATLGNNACFASFLRRNRNTVLDQNKSFDNVFD